MEGRNRNFSSNYMKFYELYMTNEEEHIFRSYVDNRGISPLYTDETNYKNFLQPKAILIFKEGRVSKL